MSALSKKTRETVKNAVTGLDSDWLDPRAATAIRELAARCEAADELLRGLLFTLNWDDEAGIQRVLDDWGWDSQHYREEVLPLYRRIQAHLTPAVETGGAR